MLFIIFSLIIFCTSIGAYVDVLANKIADRSHCPMLCDCTSRSTSFTLICPEPWRVSFNDSTINALLDYYINVSSIKKIEIRGARLTKIPEIVCSYKSLTQLSFPENDLEVVDPNCFNQWHLLESINLKQNNIEHLPDGLFRNKTMLQTVKLSYNDINSIGAHVFSNPSDIPRLKKLVLSYNKLRSLDPWPLILTRDHTIAIDLKYNYITSLTNSLQWYFLFGKTYTGRIALTGNNITRFTFLENWLSSDFEYALWNLIAQGAEIKFMIDANPFICDCIEYKWISMLVQQDMKYGVVDNLMCDSPYFPDLGHGQHSLKEVPLNFITCSESCYSNLCTCIERPANSTLHIHCHRFISLPTDLPATYWNKTYEFHLDFSGSMILSLEVMPYFASVIMLDLSYNMLEAIDVRALGELKRATVYLHNNNLRTLPRDIGQVIDSHENLTLYGNPWDCSCSEQWMQEWLLGGSESPVSLLCSTPDWLSGKDLLQADFCSEDPAKVRKHWIMVAISAVVCALFVFLVSLFILYKARMWIFAHFHVRIFNEWDDCPDCKHDAFISFAWQDYDEAHSIARLLEDEYGYQCCVHNRDFHPAERFMDQMAEAIESSERTLCLLSPNFIQSQYCVWEFSYAFNEDVRRGKKRLAAIMLEPTENFNSSNQIVRQYISNFTYIEKTDRDFKTKLLYVMAEKSLAERRAAQNSFADSSDEQCNDPLLHQPNSSTNYGTLNP